MPALRRYRVFISHAWEYNADYYRVVELLDSVPNFDWENLSVPEHDPVDVADADFLMYELRNQMRPADVFLIICGMYVAYSDWIDFELRFARRIGRPVVGILPWASERVPRAVHDAAVELVGWNANSIVSAIRQHALSQ